MGEEIILLAACGAGAIVALLTLTKFVAAIFRSISGALTQLLWWSAAASAARAVAEGRRELYGAKLAFWICAFAAEAAMRVPLFGMLLALWRPLILAVANIAADDILSLLKPAADAAPSAVERLRRKRD